MYFSVYDDVILGLVAWLALVTVWQLTGLRHGRASHTLQSKSHFNLQPEPSSSAAEDCALTELGEAQDSGIPCTAKACWPYPQPPQSTGPLSPSLSSPLSLHLMLYLSLLLILSLSTSLFISLSTSLHSSLSPYLCLSPHSPSVHSSHSLSVSIILHLSLYPSHFPYLTSFLSSFSLSPSLSYSQQLISLSTLSLHLYLPLCHHLSLFKLFKVGLRRCRSSVAPPEPPPQPLFQQDYQQLCSSLPAMIHHSRTMGPASRGPQPTASRGGGDRYHCAPADKARLIPYCFPPRPH